MPIGTQQADSQVCNKPIDGDSVFSHWNITGKYRGTTHNQSEAVTKPQNKHQNVWVVFRNLHG